MFLHRGETASRGAPDPEFCNPAGSGSMLDPDMLDPDLGLTTADNGGKVTFCTTTGRNWNDCLPCFVTELLLE